ncbi:hypothetical protein RND71_010996 [Anisodus tanguticus]|uniref:Uncharacterized protein n=1 Tax=Anisodus tanguticus TaxID=243964 RepID=A0AAE1SKW1_9SOLA|nr:hypothetical protein RND71_010996 [Anisodus tanguticus]
MAFSLSQEFCIASIISLSMQPISPFMPIADSMQEDPLSIANSSSNSQTVCSSQSQWRRESALLKYLRIEARPAQLRNPRLIGSSFNQLLTRQFSEEVRGSFLDKDEVEIASSIASKISRKLILLSDNNTGNGQKKKIDLYAHVKSEGKIKEDEEVSQAEACKAIVGPSNAARPRARSRKAPVAPETPPKSRGRTRKKTSAPKAPLKLSGRSRNEPTITGSPKPRGRPRKEPEVVATPTSNAFAGTRRQVVVPLLLYQEEKLRVHLLTLIKDLRQLYKGKPCYTRSMFEGIRREKMNKTTTSKGNASLGYNNVRCYQSEPKRLVSKEIEQIERKFFSIATRHSRSLKNRILNGTRTARISNGGTSIAASQTTAAARSSNAGPIVGPSNAARPRGRSRKAPVAPETPPKSRGRTRKKTSAPKAPLKLSGRSRNEPTITGSPKPRGRPRKEPEVVATPTSNAFAGTRRQVVVPLLLYQEEKARVHLLTLIKDLRQLGMRVFVALKVASSHGSKDDL